MARSFHKETQLLGQLCFFSAFFSFPSAEVKESGGAYNKNSVKYENFCQLCDAGQEGGGMARDGREGIGFGGGGGGTTLT